MPLKGRSRNGSWGIWMEFGFMDSDIKLLRVLNLGAENRDGRTLTGAFMFTLVPGCKC